MAELHSDIYFKHQDSDTHKSLVDLFKVVEKDAIRAEEIAIEISPDMGTTLLQSLYQDIDSKYHDSLYPESVTSQCGFGCVHLVNGGSGDYIAGRVVKFLHDLCPDLQVQAWGCGDDDPWEYWFKIVDGSVVRQDDEPLEDDEEDAYIYGTIYRWWHEDLPAKLRVGFLNDSSDGWHKKPSQVSDEEYQQWLTDLTSSPSDSDDLVAQGIESPVSSDDVKEMLGAFGELFSMFKSASGSSKNPQENAFDAEDVSEQLVLKAFDDINACERANDLDGTLKHYSKTLSGKTEVLDEDFPTGVPVTYGLYKMGMASMLKEGSEYKTEHTDLAYTQEDPQRAVLSYQSETQFKDPISRDLKTMHTDDSLVWSIVDGKLQVVEMHSREISQDASSG